MADIISTAGGISSRTVEDVQYCGGYSVLSKKTTSTLGITSIVLMVSPILLLVSFYSTEHPPQCQCYPSKVLMVSLHTTEHHSQIEHHSIIY